MNNTDFQRLLLTNDKALVNELTKPKKKAAGGGAGEKRRERPAKGKGKGKEGKDGEVKGGGKGSSGGKPSGGQAPQGPDYRDRAKERREQKGEYETVAQEFESHAEVSLDQSKYLGGDLDHTHLVKGLDYALLSKVRTEMTKQKKADELAEQRAQRKAGAQKKRAFESQLGKRVWHSIVETLHPHHSTFRKRIEGMSKAIAMGQRIRGAPSIFLPGRMAYEFDIGTDVSKASNDIPRTVYTSKEDAPRADTSKRVAPILPETVTLIGNTLRKVAEEKKQRKRERAAGGATESRYAVAQKVVTKHKAKDADEDIFAGIGSFSFTAAAKVAKARPTVTKPDHKEASAKKSSYFDDAGSEKYLRAPEGQLELSELAIDEQESGTAAIPKADDATCSFEAAERFKGARRGWVFKLGKQGLGYYLEDEAAATAEAKRAGASTAGKKRKRGAAAPAPDDDAYGECFPSSGLGHAGVATGDADSDEEGDDTKSKIERLKKLAGKGGKEGQDSVAANQKGDAKKKKMSENQQWQKIDHMIKKGKISSIEELEARSSRSGRKQAPAPREIMSTPAYF